MKKENKKTAKLIYNKELQNFYDEITIVPPLVKTHIFHLATQPVDLDTFDKNFVLNDGIDPLIYDGATKFNIPQDVFYKMLFSYRKSDPSDANLLFFLTDFTFQKAKDMKAELMQNFVMGSSSKTSRILSPNKLVMDDDDELFN